jgi:hypothetical protein
MSSATWGSPVHLKHHLKSPVALGLVTICIVMGTWIGLVVWGRLAGPTVDATDIVTVAGDLRAATRSRSCSTAAFRIDPVSIEQSLRARRFLFAQWTGLRPDRLVLRVQSLGEIAKRLGGMPKHGVLFLQVFNLLLALLQGLRRRLAFRVVSH